MYILLVNLKSIGLWMQQHKFGLQIIKDFKELVNEILIHVKMIHCISENLLKSST